MASVFSAAASGTVMSTGRAFRASTVTVVSPSRLSFGCTSTACVADSYEGWITPLRV